MLTFSQLHYVLRILSLPYTLILLGGFFDMLELECLQAEVSCVGQGPGKEFEAAWSTSTYSRSRRLVPFYTSKTRFAAPACSSCAFLSLARTIWHLGYSKASTLGTL